MGNWTATLGAIQEQSDLPGAALEKELAIWNISRARVRQIRKKSNNQIDRYMTDGRLDCRKVFGRWMTGEQALRALIKMSPFVNYAR